MVVIGVLAILRWYRVTHRRRHVTTHHVLLSPR
jgi:hypothetical protein